MDQKTVEDIMVPLDQYPHIKHDKTIAQAISVFLNARISVAARESLPRRLLVFDDLHILVGLVGRRDIIRGLEPDFMSIKPAKYKKKLFDVMPDPNLSILSFDKIIEGLGERAQKPVHQVMQPIHITINHDAPLATAISEMVNNNVSFIPVLKADQVVGVVRSAELFRELARWLKIK